MSEFERRLRTLASDQERGANELGREAVLALAAFCEESSARRLSEWLDAVHLAVARVVECRQSMAPVANRALEFERRLRRHLGSDASEHVMHARAAEAARELLEEIDGVADRVVAHGRGLLEGARRIMTLSHSGTVERVLVEAAPADCAVVVLESRPLCEGRRLALRLRRARRPVTVITDAQAGLFIEDCDRVLVGADSLGRDLGVVNKAGTRVLALLAREAGVSFVVVADTAKVQRDLDAADIPLEEKDGNEIWSGQSALTRNIYFDRTPPEWVEIYLTERGVLDAGELAAALRAPEESGAAVDRDDR